MIFNKRPVTHNTNVKLVEMPDMYQGEGFGAMQLSKVVGLARKTPSGHCRLLPPAAESSSWPPWLHITIWQDLAVNAWHLHPDNVIY